VSRRALARLLPTTLPAGLLLAIVAGACSSAGEPAPARGLTAQLADGARVLFDELEGHGVRARSGFALFVSEGSVDPRHLQKFRRALEGGVRRAAADSSLRLMTSSDRVFFLSEVRPPSWPAAEPDPVGAGGAGGAAALVTAFRNGTHEGWVAFHDYWSQYNRLAIGDSAWLASLPASVRADLAQPVDYVLRVDVVLEESRGLAEFVHDVSLQLVEVGSERVVHARGFPVTLTYPLS